MEKGQQNIFIGDIFISVRNNSMSGNFASSNLVFSDDKWDL